MRDGFSLIDLVLAIGIISLLFGGIFLVYFSIVDTAANYELRRAAASIIGQRMELVRNLPYEQVGVVGGIPAGTLPQSEQVSWEGTTFVVSAAVRNVDDPFDGTATSTPADTAPADYRLVEFSVACPACERFTPIAMTTTVAPRGLESTSQNGSLFITVFDADGGPVSGADVHITNASTLPAIDFSEITDSKGMLQLVDVPTSTLAYHIVVTKDGYSTEQTYPQGGAGNPNPLKPDATVSSQSVTQLSFAIDRLGSVPVYSSGYRCEAVSGAPFTLTSAKLIGTAPDVPKRTFSATTGSDGISTMPLAEWDSYSVIYGGTGSDLAGTVPLLPLTVAPGATQPLRFVLLPEVHPALLITVRDTGTGLAVPASLVVDGPGAPSAGATGEATYAVDAWADTDYDVLSGTAVTATGFTMAPEGGPYPTSTVTTLESATIDLGGTPASALALSWEGSGGSGPDPIRFQVAGSDTDGGWNYVGPDGSPASYFTSPGSVVGSAAGKRYVRYRAYLQTDNAFVTPSVESVSLNFTGPCVPPGQRLFQGLPSGSYQVTASASGYATATSTVSVGSGWRAVDLVLTPQ